MKSYDELAVEELRKINDHLKNTCRLLNTLCESEKETTANLLFLRNELYSYYRKVHPEDKEIKGNPNMRDEKTPKEDCDVERHTGI